MIVQVALPIPVTKLFSYSVPEAWADILEPFQRVIVPFRERAAVGYVTGHVQEMVEGLKEVREILDPFPLLDDGLIRLGLEAAEELATPLGLVLKCMLPPRMRLNRHLLVMETTGPRNDLQHLSLAVTMQRLGWFEALRLVRCEDLKLHDRFTDLPFCPLSPCLKDREASRTLFVSPVDGRMARYAKEIEEAIDSGGNVLMLVPDHHAVGRYVYGRLAGLFPGKVFWYGSTVRHRDRMEAYFRARQNNGIIILGSISCVFLPIRDLALVMVERPQEEDFRNEEGFRFNAVAMAIKRAVIEGARLLIGTPAPTVDLYQRALAGELVLVEPVRLRAAAHSTFAVEKRPNAPDGSLEVIMPVMEAIVRAKGRLAIYTARRDYSSSIRCLACGSPFLCPHCEGRLSYRKDRDVLTCRRCGRYYPYEESCRHCGSDLVTSSVTGVEYLEEQLQNRFGDVPVLKVTSETTEKGPLNALEGLRGPAIVVGTQAISKLYGFKADALICVGWEEMLRVGGYRAEEKIFQLFMNLQDALSPEILYLATDRRSPREAGFFLDREKFYATTLENRKAAAFPPFFRLFLVSWTGVGEKAGRATLKKAGQAFEGEGLCDTMITSGVEKRGAAWRWTAIVRRATGMSVAPLLQLWSIPGVRIEADPPDL